MTTLGPFCDVVNITRENFFEQFPLLNQSDLKNRLILEVRSFKQDSILTWKDIRKFICVIFECDDSESLSDSAVCTSFNLIHKNASKVKGKKSDAKHIELYNIYLNKLYNFPNRKSDTTVPPAPPCDVTNTTSYAKDVRLQSMQTDIEKLKIQVSISEQHNQRHEQVEAELRRHISALKSRNELLRKQLGNKIQAKYADRILQRTKASSALWRTMYLRKQKQKQC